MKLPHLTVRLGHKIAAIGALGTIGLVAIATIYMVGLRSQEEHRVTAAQARTIAALNAKLATTCWKHGAPRRISCCAPTTPTSLVTPISGRRSAPTSTP